MRAPDGSIRWLMGLGGIARDPTGKIVKLYGINIDISDRKHAEELLTEADRRKDEFLATLAHELRNPLAPISNALQLWPRLENQPEQLRSIRAMMERQVTQLKHLIDDLLDISRISRGKIELHKEPLELRELLEGAIESVWPVIDAAKHSLHVDLPDAPVVLIADRGRLTQILGNIIHNSAKYTPSAGTITVSARTDGESAVVSVQDTGVGIPAEMLHSIFEPFTQVDRSLERAQGGLGIGLTLVKKLIELHGGTIEARSEGIGKGSEFIMRLPLYAPPPRPSALPAARTTPPDATSLAPPRDDLPHHRILVVDDLHSSADTMRMMLEHLGQEAQAAYDGEAALRAVESFHPDLVISDVAMPGMDGYHLAAELRRRHGAGITLAALTGYGQESDRERVMAAGFDHHLVKPAGIDSLCELLSQAPRGNL